MTSVLRPSSTPTLEAMSPSAAVGGSSRRSTRSPSRPGPRQAIDLSPDEDATISHPQAQPQALPSTRSIIDLTASSPKLPAQAVPPPSTTRDEDIVFTGSRQPDVSFLGVSRPGHVPSASTSASRSGSAVGEGSSTSRARRHDFPGEISDDVDAGAFTNDRLVIHDSPPLRVRSNPLPPPPPPAPRASTSGERNRLGGGGIFSRGRFSGLIAHGISGLTNLYSGGRAGDDGDEGGGGRVIVGWQGEGRRGGGGARARRGGGGAHEDVDLAATLLAAGVDPDFDYPGLIAAIYPAVHHHHHNSLVGTDQVQEAPPIYRTKDSHPHRLAPGFARDIIPPDREVLTLDPETQTLRAEKEELVPVCASCERELVMGQEGSSGRRPWILACGHVVDGRCLEEATERLKAQKASQTSPRSRGRGRGRGRGGARGGAGVVRTEGRASARQAKPYSVPEGQPDRKGKGKVIDLEADDPAEQGRRAAEEVVKGWWVKCPVGGCDGDGGDLLARKRTRNAPWEMFV